MRIRIITVSALGLLSLMACSDRKADSTADSVTNARDAAPTTGPATPPSANLEGMALSVETPPTLPPEPSTTSPATSPPPQ